MVTSIYEDKTYLDKNPSWHEEDSPWKASQVVKMLRKQRLDVGSVADVGCGVGEVLSQVCSELRGNLLADDAVFHGYDVSTHAIERAREKVAPGLEFFAEDLFETGKRYDLLMAIDVFEHVPDYLGFLSKCRDAAKYKLYHIPLDINVLSVMRRKFRDYRKDVGHLHHFTADTALATLADTGHTVIDYFYTDGAISLAHLHPSYRKRLANSVRRPVSYFSTPLAALVLGGFSLMVLAE
ncbi:MAG: methylase [Planctomycetaceae bacterium]|nr:methylase [Planctomycetaceae bacterium]